MSKHMAHQPAKRQHAKHTKNSRRHSPRAWHTSRPIVVSITTIAFCLLAGMFAWGAASAAGGPTDTKGPSVTNFTKQPWCGEAGQPVCPAPDPGWIALSGTTPGAVASAIAQSDIFKMLNAQHGGFALDLPALVHTLAAPSGYDYFDDDHWVVSVRDSSDHQVGLYDFVYDRANARVRFASYGVLTPNDAAFGHAFPSVASGTAIGRLQAERHLGAKSGMQPDLVFFPLADDAAGPRATISWTGGGGSPLDAMWRLTGADGATYFVGQDLHVYDLSSLPIKAGKP